MVRRTWRGIVSCRPPVVSGTGLGGSSSSSLTTRRPGTPTRSSPSASASTANAGSRGRDCPQPSIRAGCRRPRWPDGHGCLWHSSPRRSRRRSPPRRRAPRAQAEHYGHQHAAGEHFYAWSCYSPEDGWRCVTGSMRRPHGTSPGTGGPFHRVARAPSTGWSRYWVSTIQCRPSRHVRAPGRGRTRPRYPRPPPSH